jgi:caffeoyl-CoA O-methyltransferase
MIVGHASDIIPSLEGPFDMVFLDADKENYTHYYQLVVPKMRSGGILLADNVLWSGRVVDENVHDLETDGLRDFVNFVSHDAQVEHLLLPVRDGIMMVRKK